MLCAVYAYICAYTMCPWCVAVCGGTERMFGGGGLAGEQNFQMPSLKHFVAKVSKSVCVFEINYILYTISMIYI